MAKKIPLSVVDMQNIVAEPSLQSLDTPSQNVKNVTVPVHTMPATPKLSWEEWNYVNLEEFRVLFPEFRQLEQTAVPQILTDFFKNQAPDLRFYEQIKVTLANNKNSLDTLSQRASHQHYVQDMDKMLYVYELLQNDTQLYQRTQDWAKKVKANQQSKKVIETPTVFKNKR